MKFVSIDCSKNAMDGGTHEGDGISSISCDNTMSSTWTQVGRTRNSEYGTAPGAKMMMIAFITFKSSLVPVFEGLWSSNSWEFELSGFRRNRTDDLGIDSPSLWPTEPRLHVRINIYICTYVYMHIRAIHICICVYTYIYMTQTQMTCAQTQT